MLNVKGVNHCSCKRYYFIGGKNYPPSCLLPSSLFSGSRSFRSLSVPGFCFPFPDGILLVSCATALLFSAPVPIGLRLLLFETVGVSSSARCISAYWLQSFPACARFFWPSCFQWELCLALIRQWLWFPWSRYPRAGACPRHLDVGTSSGMFRDVFAFPINNAETINKWTTP